MSIFLRLYVCVVSVCVSVCMCKRPCARACACIACLLCVLDPRDSPLKHVRRMCQSSPSSLFTNFKPKQQQAYCWSLRMTVENGAYVDPKSLSQSHTHTHTSRLRQFTTAEGGSGITQHRAKLARLAATCFGRTGARAYSRTHHAIPAVRIILNG